MAAYDLKIYYAMSDTVPPPMASKLANEVLLLNLDYSHWLVPGEHLANVVASFTPPGGPAVLVLGGVTIGAGQDGTLQAMASLNVSAGNFNVANYTVLITAYTDAGTPRVKQDQIPLTVGVAAQSTFPGGYPIGDSVEQATPPTVWVGTGLPWQGLGVNGDYYINEATKAIYGPMVNSLWPGVPSYALPAWYSPNSVV